MPTFIQTDPMTEIRFPCYHCKTKAEAIAFFIEYHGPERVNNKTVSKLKKQKERVEFSWTWEVVENDRVVTYIDWEGDAPKGYETLTEWSQDNGGITYARKWAKKWARQNDREFYEEKLANCNGGNSGYGAAVLAAYRAENG